MPVLRSLQKKNSGKLWNPMSVKVWLREYLDMLLPEDWDTMDLYERRAYINGTEFGESQEGWCLETKIGF
jgi:hypothetical protein